jgi:hypothetical protein
MACNLHIRFSIFSTRICLHSRRSHNSRLNLARANAFFPRLSGNIRKYVEIPGNIRNFSRNGLAGGCPAPRLRHMQRLGRAPRLKLHAIRDTQHPAIPRATGHGLLTNLLSYPTLYQNQNRILKPTVGLTRFFYFRVFGLPTPVSPNKDSSFINYSKSDFLPDSKNLFL